MTTSLKRKQHRPIVAVINFCRVEVIHTKLFSCCELQLVCTCIALIVQVYVIIHCVTWFYLFVFIVKQMKN